MADTLQIGIIGTSWWADMMYLPSLKSHPRADVRAICGRNQERAQEMASKYSIPEVYSDYRALIESDSIQAVVVSTPDDLHHPMAIAAIDAGLHVLCEKPMALNAAHAAEMTSGAEAAGVKHMVLFTHRWMPHIRYLLELIEEGYVGRCYECSFRFAGGYARDTNYHWKWDRQRGLGVLGDLGSHMIDLAHLCVGDVARVSASLPTFYQRDGVGDAANDAALITLVFKNGAHGLIQSSAVAHVADRMNEQRFVLHGSEGTLEIDFSFGRGYDIKGSRSGAEQFEDLTIPPHLFEGLDPEATPLDHANVIFTTQPVGPRLFVDSVLDDLPLSPSFHDGLRVQRVIDAANESHATGTWVAVED